MCYIVIASVFGGLNNYGIHVHMDTVINSTPNAVISRKHENRFFLIKLKILYILALNFPHVS